MMEEQEFNETLNKLIKEKGMSNDDVARFFDISIPTIERWKKGETLPHGVIRVMVIDKLKKAKVKKRVAF